MSKFFIVSVVLTICCIGLLIIIFILYRDFKNLEEGYKDAVRLNLRLNDELKFSRKERFNDLCEFAKATAHYVTAITDKDPDIDDCK